jgi:hypothetical protein
MSTLADPRLTKYFFAPSGASGSIVHRVFGTDGDLTAQPNTTVAANYSWVFIADDWTQTGTTQSGNGALNRATMMTLAESHFLQAEAAVRGIITDGATASAAYTAGLTASLTAAKVATADRTTHLVNQGWDPTWTTAQQIEHILNEKYIANYFLNMFESYCDYRRTGYPNPKRPNYAADPASDPSREMLTYYPGGYIRRQIPRIFPYPQADYDINKASVQAAIDIQIQENGVTFTTDSYPFDARVFWDTAPKSITYNY